MLDTAQKCWGYGILCFHNTVKQFWCLLDHASLEQRCKQPTRCNKFRLLIFSDQLYMFRVTNSPILRSTFGLYIQSKSGICCILLVAYIVEGKAIPAQALKIPVDWGCQISRQLAHEVCKVASPRLRSTLPPRKIFLVLISVRAILLPEGLCHWKGE